MKMQNIIDEIRLELTGHLLEMEIDDKTIKQVVKKALRELERYIDETTMITVPFASCIDFSNTKINGKPVDVSSVVKVYRTANYGETSTVQGLSDPMFAQQWMLFSNGGTMYNLNDYVLNYAAWNTMSKIKNTLSTDLSFKEDRHNNRLYINGYLDRPASITIEFIPKFTKPEDVKSDYWTDILIKMSVALTKIVLGRIRTRFTQSNALWTQDGEKLLEEGNTELRELREILRVNSQMILPID